MKKLILLLLLSSCSYHKPNPEGTYRITIEYLDKHPDKVIIYKPQTWDDYFYMVRPNGTDVPSVVIVDQIYYNIRTTKIERIK